MYMHNLRIMMKANFTGQNLAHPGIPTGQHDFVIDRIRVPFNYFSKTKLEIKVSEM